MIVSILKEQPEYKMIILEPRCCYRGVHLFIYLRACGALGTVLQVFWRTSD